MENIYKQFMNNFNNEEEVSLEVIRNYTKDIIDLLDLNKYIVNVVETTDKNIIAQYDHDRKIIEYNIKKINDYAMKNNKNKSKRELIFDNIIMNLQTIRHEIRHAEQNKNYYEPISNIERLIYIDSLCSAEIYDMMYYYCPIEIDANFEGIVEIDNFFKKTNYLNQEMSKEKALSFVKNSLLSLYKDENDEMVSPALLYYMALGKEKRYQMLKVSMKTNELKLRYGFNITDGLLNDIMGTNDIKKIIKKV